MDARSRDDGSFDLIGVFNQVAVRVFPLRFSLSVHYNLSGGPGLCEMEVGACMVGHLVQRGVPHVVELGGALHFRDLVVALQLDIAEPGVFMVWLYANDELVAARAFAVYQEAEVPVV
jgi:hypothetical protein